MKGKFLISIIVFLQISIQAIGQIDNSKVIETDQFSFQPEKDSKEKQNTMSSAIKINKGAEVTPFGSLEDISKNFPEYSVAKSSISRDMVRTRPVEKDVMVKKFWNGKDVSQVKIKTEIELGRIETSTKSIRIECRDHSYVDGDRVRVMVNGQVLLSNIVLKAGYYVINIDLKEGFNRVDIQALNQGMSGPNTAEFNVFDASGNMVTSKEWNLPTGYVATLVVLKN